MWRRTFGLALLIAGAAIAAACNADPVHTQEVQALGPEAPGVPAGPNHRAGQPCLVCHGPEGPAHTQFVVAGTVFYGPSSTPTAVPVGVENANVTIEDDTTATSTFQTNCVGNFYVRAQDWPAPGGPQFPLLVTISGTNQMGQTITDSMLSHIGRDGSCGSCHLLNDLPNDYDTPGLVHLAGVDDSNYTGDTQNCSPVPAQYGGGI